MYNVITMRIERDGVELLKDDSETSLDNYGNWDIVVENNGTIEEFKSKIMEAVKCYLKSC
jgi:dephospho-CoA kinase